MNCTIDMLREKIKGVLENAHLQPEKAETSGRVNTLKINDSQ